MQWPQQGGQFLLAVGDERAAAGNIVVQVREALQARGWPGDDVLVDQLQGRLAALDQVDLDLLASVLDGPDGGVLNLHDGMTFPADLVEDAELDLGGPGQVDVPGLGAGQAWRDRRSFVETLPEGHVHDRLARALEGREGFRRFGLDLDRHESLVAPFLAWRDERTLGRARNWLREQGLLDLP